MARSKLPQILVASDLLEGDVVFYGTEGWIRDHHGARVAHSADETASLEAIGKAEVAANRVVEVTLIDVEIKPDGTPEPHHYRERLRTLGPSTRPDLGKQAGRGGRST
jgi:sulfite reductase (NADPH) hemoprotein beta-component